MQVALLAAGLGSRLGALTERLPKALISVAGEPLLQHALRFAQRLAPSEIVVVGGFGFVEVRAALGELPRAGSSPVRLVENPRFRDGNLLSLMAARPHLGGDFLLMNVDHIYRPGIAARVTGAASADWVTAFVDVDRPLGPDDMKVARDPEGRVSAIAKTLGVFDAGYVGMTRVPESATRRYWAAADAVLGREGSAIHVERVLAELAAGSSAERPRCLDVSGIGWLEVDLAEERALAERTIEAAPAEWI